MGQYSWHFHAGWRIVPSRFWLEDRTGWRCSASERRGTAGVTQNWDKALPATQRFVVLAAFNNESVRDNNTGLVWEKSPAITTVVQHVAAGTCINKTVGLQKGWRLPSVPELASLIDPSVPLFTGPMLPPGHPFVNVRQFLYWSASTFAEDQNAAWHVGFDNGEVQIGPKANTWHVWCVRGPMNADAY